MTVRMNKEQYREYLKSPEWQATRDRFLTRFEVKKCETCESETGPFHVHHVSYKCIGREKMKDLRLVCQSCHYKIHATVNEIREVYSGHLSIRGATDQLRRRNKRPKKGETPIELRVKSRAMAWLAQEFPKDYEQLRRSGHSPQRRLAEEFPERFEQLKVEALYWFKREAELETSE